MPATSTLASRAPFDTANFILPAEWHTLGELLGADTCLLLLQDDCIQRLNPALAARLGYDADELAGQALEALLPMDAEAGGMTQLAPRRTLMLRAKWGALVPFEVVEYRIDPLSEARCSIVVLRAAPAPESDLPEPGAPLLAITEQWPDMVLICDTDAGIRYANRAFGQFAGPHGDGLLTLVHHEERAAVGALLEQAAGAASLPLEMRLRRADHSWAHVSGTVVNLLSHPDVQGLLLNVRDISQEVALRQRQDSERKRQLHYLNRLLRAARRPQPNLEFALKLILKSAAKALGVQRCAYSEITEGKSVRGMITYDDVRQNTLEEASDALFAQSFEPLLRKVLDARQPLALEDVDRDPRSALYCEYLHAHDIKALLMAPVVRDDMPEGVLLLIVAGTARQWRRDEIEFAENVSGLLADTLAAREHVRSESRLRDAALEDSLTGMPSGDYLRRQAAGLFARLTLRADTLTALMVNIDGYVEVAEQHGYLLGDELIKAAALRLKNAVRRDDLLVRLDRDAFLLVARDLPNRQVTEDIAQEIIDSMRNPFSLQGRLVRVSASVGTARYPDDGSDLDTLISKAAGARYEAKAAGHGHSRAYAGDASSARAETPAAQLRRAIGQRELRHYYQPQVDLRSGRVRGVEALLRWQHPQHGLLLPASFLPLAERGQEMRELSAWALDDACRQAAQWSALGIDGFTVALKLSAAQLADAQLLPALGAAMRRHGLHAHQVECELKGSLLRDAGNDSTLSTRIRELVELGARICLDEIPDGGLQALAQRYPLHKVKIDASPAEDTQENDAATSPEADIASAHALGLEVVAKGVETSQQADALRRQGCDIGLGYYFTQPLTADQFEKWLNSPR